VRIAQDPEIKQRLEAQAFDVTAAPLADTAAYVRSELAKWGKVVREVGAKVD
jgi:tripartite-type tricarboxylate transporter receptor subunit TctC